jgi:hypothetical protein
MDRARLALLILLGIAFSSAVVYAAAQADSGTLSWPTSIPISWASVGGSAIAAVVSTLAALRFGMRRALAASEAAKRQAEEANRGLLSTKSDVYRIEKRLAGMATKEDVSKLSVALATVEEAQRQTQLSVGELANHLRSDRDALDKQMGAILGELLTLTREGCGRAGSCR